MKRIWIFIVLLLFVFTSCHVTPTQTDEQTAADSAVLMIDADENIRYLTEYETYSLDAIDGIGIVPYSGSSFMRDGLFYADAETGFCVYDADGTCIDTVSFTDFSRGSNTNMTLLCDGTFVVMESVNEPTLTVIDAAGQILYQTALPSTYIAGMTCILRADADSIYVMQGGTLYRYTTTLELQRTYFLPGEYGTAMHIRTDGTLFLGDRYSNFSAFDPNSEKTTLFFDDSTIAQRKDDFLYIGIDDSIYGANEAEVYRIATDETAKTILTWTSGSARFHRSLYVLDADTVFAYTVNGMENREAYYRLSPYTVQEDAGRRILTLAMLDIDVTGYMTALINGFNQMSDAYYIDVIMYDSEQMLQSYAQLEELFLYGGEQPDMLCLFNAMYTKLNETMADKHAFVDLMPYYGEQLLGGLPSAYTVNGEMPFLPLGITMSTLAARAEDAAAAPVTLSRMKAQAEDGKILFSDPNAADTLYDIGMTDFIDYERGVCSFDSSEFRALIRFSEQAKLQYTDTALGYFNYFNHLGDSLAVSALSLSAALQDGTLCYLATPLSSAMHYLSLKLLYEEVPFSLCGYPLEDGYGIQTAGAHFLCVTAQSSNKGGAKEFLDYALSVQSQTSRLLTDSYFPVTQEAAAQCLIRDVYYFTPREDWDIYYLFDEETLQAVPNGYYITPMLTRETPLTEEQLQTYLDKGYDLTAYRISEDECAQIMDFLNQSTMDGGISRDATVHAILEEELSAYESGAKSLDEVSKLIQSRVSIYLAERQ